MFGTSTYIALTCQALFKHFITMILLNAHSRSVREMPSSLFKVWGLGGMGSVGLRNLPKVAQQSQDLTRAVWLQSPRS